MRINLENLTAFQRFDYANEIKADIKLDTDNKTIVNYKDFECSRDGELWYENDCSNIFAVLQKILDGICIVRLKPQPKFVPFDDGGEFWEHKDKWVWMKNSPRSGVFKICEIYRNIIRFTNDGDDYNYRELFDLCEFVDNPFSENPIVSPCGKLQK